MSSTLSHLFVHVRDLAPLRSFYGAALGLPVAQEPGSYVRIGASGQFQLGVEVVPELIDVDETELVVRVPDVDAVYRALMDHGAAADGPPANMPWGLRQVWTRDPNGLRVSAYTPLG